MLLKLHFKWDILPIDGHNLGICSKNQDAFFDFLKQPSAPFFNLREVFYKNSYHAKCYTAMSFSSCDENLWKISAKESVFNIAATFNFIYLTSHNFTLTLAFWPKL